MLFGCPSCTGNNPLAPHRCNASVITVKMYGCMDSWVFSRYNVLWFSFHINDPLMLISMPTRDIKLENLFINHCKKFNWLFLQALDAAMKQYKALSPETAALFFTVDQSAGKIVCMSCTPKVSFDGTNNMLG